MPDPLEGKTLEAILNDLVAHYGWAALGEKIAINCFTKDPSVTSSLKFLRRTPWARAKVEKLYLSTIGKTGSRQSEPTKGPEDDDA